MNEKSDVDFSKRELHTLSHHNLALCVCLIIQVLCTEGNTDDDGVGSQRQEEEGGWLLRNWVTGGSLAVAVALPMTYPPS